MRIETSWPTNSEDFAKAEAEIEKARFEVIENHRRVPIAKSIRKIANPAYTVGIVTGFAYNLTEVIGWADHDNIYQIGPFAVAATAVLADSIAQRTSKDNSLVEFEEAQDRILRKYGGTTMIEGVSYKIVE